jgi:hypothetical protein
MFFFTYYLAPLVCYDWELILKQWVLSNMGRMSDPVARSLLTRDNTTHKITWIGIHSPRGFEPTIPAVELSISIRALDRAANMIRFIVKNFFIRFWIFHGDFFANIFPLVMQDSFRRKLMLLRNKVYTHSSIIHVEVPTLFTDSDIMFLPKSFEVYSSTFWQFHNLSEVHSFLKSLQNMTARRRVCSVSIVVYIYICIYICIKELWVSWTGFNKFNIDKKDRQTS